MTISIRTPEHCHPPALSCTEFRFDWLRPLVSTLADWYNVIQAATTVGFAQHPFRYDNRLGIKKPNQCFITSKHVVVPLLESNVVQDCCCSTWSMCKKWKGLHVSIAVATALFLQSEGKMWALNGWGRLWNLKQWLVSLQEESEDEAMMDVLIANLKRKDQMMMNKKKITHKKKDFNY